jgi:hypothetical protein
MVAEARIACRRAADPKPIAPRVLNTSTAPRARQMTRFSSLDRALESGHERVRDMAYRGVLPERKGGK